MGSTIGDKVNSSQPAPANEVVKKADTNAYQPVQLKEGVKKTEFQSQVNEALADGKLSPEEFKSLSKNIRGGEKALSEQLKGLDFKQDINLGFSSEPSGSKTEEKGALVALLDGARKSRMPSDGQDLGPVGKVYDNFKANFSGSFEKAKDNIFYVAPDGTKLSQNQLKEAKVNGDMETYNKFTGDGVKVKYIANPPSAELKPPVIDMSQISNTIPDFGPAPQLKPPVIDMSQISKTIPDFGPAIELKPPVIDISQFQNNTIPQFKGPPVMPDKPVIDTSQFQNNTIPQFKGPPVMPDQPVIDTSQFQNNTIPQFKGPPVMPDKPVIDTSQFQNNTIPQFKGPPAMHDMPVIDASQVKNNVIPQFKGPPVMDKPLIDTSQIRNDAIPQFNGPPVKPEMPNLDTSQIQNNTIPQFKGPPVLPEKPVIDTSNVANSSQGGVGIRKTVENIPVNMESIYPRKMEIMKENPGISLLRADSMARKEAIATALGVKPEDLASMKGNIVAGQFSGEVVIKLHN